MNIEEYDRRRSASQWMVTKDVDSEGGPIAIPWLQCPHCQSTDIEQTRRFGLMKSTSYVCLECDSESLPIQPDDGY